MDQRIELCPQGQGFACAFPRAIVHFLGQAGHRRERPLHQLQDLPDGILVRPAVQFVAATLSAGAGQQPAGYHILYDDLQVFLGNLLPRGNILQGDILPLIVLMVATGLYFTVRSGFFQFRYFGRIWKHTIGTVFSGKRQNLSNREGMLSPFEAIATAIGGTVGFGNIAGVATAVAAAVAAGGPGAVFWMWATACLGMILKQVEVTLGLYYRRHKENGDTYGGPTYYMELGLGEKHHWGKLWLIPGVIFAIGIFSTFFVTSSTLTAAQVVSGALHLGDLHIGSLTIEGIILVGAVLAVITFFITSGGTKGVASIFSRLVPIMSVVYVLMGIVMILVNLPAVPGAFASIFTMSCSQ